MIVLARRAAPAAGRWRTPSMNWRQQQHERQREREREERKINKKWSSSGDFTCDRNRKMKNEKIEKKKILELKVVAGRKETAAGMAATISLFTFSVHCKCLYLGFNIHTHTHTRQPTK